MTMYEYDHYTITYLCRGSSAIPLITKSMSIPKNSKSLDSIWKYGFWKNTSTYIPPAAIIQIEITDKLGYTRLYRERNKEENAH